MNFVEIEALSHFVAPVLGSREQARPVRAHRLARTNRLHRRVQHRVASERVHVYKLHSGHGRARQHGAGNGIRNIVEFQIEKNARPQCGNFPHSRRTRRGKKLAANLEHSDKIGNLLREFQRGIKGIKIESNDQAASWMCVEGQGRV